MEQNYKKCNANTDPQLCQCMYCKLFQPDQKKVTLGNETIECEKDKFLAQYKRPNNIGEVT